MPQMTPPQFARWLKGYPARLHKEVGKGEAATVRKGKSVGLAYSSGTRSATRLRLLHHPYAKGFVGSLPTDPAILNTQSGLFRRSWQMQPPSSLLNTGDMITKLLNTAPYAVYLNAGTRAQIARPFVARIVADTQQTRLEQANTAVNRAWYGR